MHTKNNKLYFGKVSAESLAEKFGTPLYVYEEDVIRNRFSDLKDGIKYKNLKIHYAVKANNNINILRLLKSLGANVETVSVGAVKLALKAGFKTNQIIHTCNGMDDEELKFLIRKNIMTNIDSLTQMEKWGRYSPNSKVSLRLNQDIGEGSHRYFVTGGEDSKFGIHISHIDEARKISRKYGLKIVGLQQHIGTDSFLEYDLFIKATKALMKTADDFENLEFLDFGGSYGIPYRPGEKPLDIKKLGREFMKIINDFNKNYRKKINVIIEPGRYIMAESGTLISKVTDVKTNPSRIFVSIDSGMNHLIRPSLYNSYHEVVNASKTSGKKITASVVGNICESSDFFAKDRELVNPKIGDIIAILNTGAYGFSMASDYNSRPKPAEVLVKKEKINLIRERATI